MIVAAALLYFVAVLAIGMWAARRTRDTRDYFIAGRRLGLTATGFGTMAAAFSGVVFVGGPGLTARWGVGSFFIWLSVGFTAALLCWTVARPLVRMAAGGDVLTVVDAVYARYRCRRTAGLAALAVVAGCIGYVSAQLLALGVMFYVFFGWSIGWSIVAGAAIVVAYSAAGGMVAGAYTDLLQGGLMALAAVVVFLSALAWGGGPAALLDGLGARTDGFLEPFGRNPALGGLGLYFVFGIGVLGQPQMLHRFLMIRDESRLRWLPLVLGGSQTTVLLVWIGLGLAASLMLLDGRADVATTLDEASPAFLLTQVPRPVAALAFVAAISAIMSTADSLLNIGAGALVRDLPRALGRTLPRELPAARLATVLLAAAAALLAAAYGDLIALLGTLAFGTFAAALAPALALGLHWKRAGAAAASASIVTGLVLTVAFELAARSWPGKLLAQGMPPAAAALAGSLLVFVAVGWRRGQRS